MQASRMVRGHATPRNVLDFNSLKSPFLESFEISHLFTQDGKKQSGSVPKIDATDKGIR